MASWPIAALLTVAAAAPVAAQPPGQTVVAQSVTVEGRVLTDPGVLDLIETAPGRPFSPADVRESIAHLVSLGRYDDVIVSRDAVAGGVALRYDLVPARNVRSIDFVGDVGVSESDLRRRVRDRFGASVKLARLDEVLSLLRAAYRDEGYLEARLTPRPGLQGEKEDTLVIDVEAGPRLRITDITVSGNSPDALAGIPASLGLSRGQAYRRAEVDRKLDEYVASLRSRGYYEARAEHELQPSPDGRTGQVAISVDGGPHVTIVFEGDPLPERVRTELVPIEREGSLDEDLLEDSANQLRDYLHAQGYRQAEVEYARTPRNGELAVVFRIHQGPQFRIAMVDLAGARAVPAIELQPLLKTRVGEPVVEGTVDADAGAIAEAYHRRGFPDVKVTPDVVPEPGAGSPVPTDIRFDITEGPRALIGSIAVRGNADVGDQALLSGLTSHTGQPYYQAQVALDRDGILVQLLNRGYQNAAVTAQVLFSPDHIRADVSFVVSEGPQVFVDHVLVIGNVRTSSETIRREVTLKAGAPLSYSDVAESQRRLSALGLFRRVHITELDHDVPDRRDILVAVEEAPTTTLGYGGGLEGGRVLRTQVANGPATEVFEVAPRGFVEFGRRNLFGRNRSINLFARASLRSRASTSNAEVGQPLPTGLTVRDYRLLGTYRSPRLFGSRSDLLLTGFLEQGVRSSFNFTRRGARVELARRLGPSLSLSGRYALQRTNLFDERFDPADKPLIDRLFPQVRLSTFSGSLIRDTRDDPLGPTRGALLGVDGDLAARAIGSEVGYVKIFTQGFLYRRLPGRRGVVFAGGARLGLATGFDRGVVQTDENGDPVIGPGGQPIVEIVNDLPASERFFAGGDTSVRGYALDRLGTSATIDRNGFPTGGNAVIVLNGELRVPVWRDIGVVGFLDAGNVWDRVHHVDLTGIRPTSGFGLRYQSPIGPIRVDLGFKLDRQVLPDGSLERLTALHISLGQAF